MKKLFLLFFAFSVLVEGIAQNHWNPNIHQFPTNMNIIATIEVNGVEQMNEYLEIGVFCGEECRGSQILKYYQAPVDRYLLFLTAYGENGDLFTFRLYDHLTDQELELSCTNEISYLSNDIIGLLFTPYVFSFYGGEECVLSVTANPTEGGTVAGGGNVVCGTSCTVSASPVEGCTFLGWSYNGTIITTDTVYALNVLTDVSLVAHFLCPTPMYVISVSASPEDGGSVEGDGEYEEGSICEVSAMANDGFVFLYWKDAGVTVSEQPVYSFEVSGNRDLVACFDEIVVSGPFEIVADVSPDAGGVVTGAGTYDAGELCSLLVELSENYEFLNWTENGLEVSTDNPYEFEVEQSRSLVANVVYINAIPEYQLHSHAYPNPTQGRVVIAVPEGFPEGSVVTIHDVNGKLLLLTKEPSFDLSGFNDGVYFVAVDGHPVGKVVLKH